ncbi:MAG: hypothetical protein R3C59_08945 [Planctomycetaceae bacterium]
MPAVGKVITTPIQEIRVGQRILAHNPEVSRSERRSWGPEPDFSRWLHLTLEMPKPDGSTLTIQMLRPEEWLEAQMSYVIRDRDIPADGRDIPADDGVAGVKTSDAVTPESLPHE